MTLQGKTHNSTTRQYAISKVILRYIDSVPHQEFHLVVVLVSVIITLFMPMMNYNSISLLVLYYKRLQWPSLEKRRFNSRFCILYKTLYDPNMPVEIPCYFMHTQYATRQHHPLHFILPHISTTYYQQSYFPRTIRME